MQHFECILHDNSDEKTSFGELIGTFRDDNFKTMLRKYAQSIRLPRNRFIYTQKWLELTARRRFFLCGSNGDVSIPFPWF